MVLISSVLCKTLFTKALLFLHVYTSKYSQRNYWGVQLYILPCDWNRNEKLFLLELVSLKSFKLLGWRNVFPIKYPNQGNQGTEIHLKQALTRIRVKLKSILKVCLALSWGLKFRSSKTKPWTKRISLYVPRKVKTHFIFINQRLFFAIHPMSGTT